MKILILLLIFVFIASCSTVRYKYESEVKIGDQKGSYVLEKNFDPGSVRGWCIWTFWAYGGGCWGYTSLPNEDQKNMVSDYAKKRLAFKYNANIEFFDPKITKMGYEELAEVEKIEIKDADKYLMPSKYIPQVSPPATDGFLR